ncbi:cyclin-like protein [Irpex rosettiformis]|uniref:Cyclin-like protein n=1 Tax=Irpex rosettiformis TaxID=378272 RepID=A0ACB8UHH8_9APHY|nr:cyclin-like protein [Irpex rosettiformis]
MGAPSTSAAQWLFPVSALVEQTPSRTTSSISVERELYDRARGVEFLFRLGVSLMLPVPSLYTAATWFHRFYMRFSMEDYHRQDVGAACIFLATKTEECGRKLKDVAKVFCSKVWGKKMEDIADDSQELEDSQMAILLTEEVLLEALCFDFVVRSPHTDLVDLLEARQETPEFEEYAFSIANDSYRTPLCILYPPRIIAVACYVLAQQYVEGTNSPSLSPPYPESMRFAVEFYNLNEMELVAVADALTILLEFYAAQDLSTMEYLSSIATISPPEKSPARQKLYQPFVQLAQGLQKPPEPGPPEGEPTSSSQPQPSPSKQPSEDTPNLSKSNGWIPVRSDPSAPDLPEKPKWQI